MALHYRMVFGMFVTGVLLALTGCGDGPETPLEDLGTGPTRLMIKTLDRGTRHRQYALFVPLSYGKDKTTRFPVIIHLHPLADHGNDPRAIFPSGLGVWVENQIASFPFIVIFPQSEDGWWKPDSEDAADVIAELDAVAATYPIDTDRVTLTGIGTGGRGTWAIGAKYPDRFAALVPMASTGSSLADAGKLIHVPVRAYHNGGDWLSPVANDEAMVQKINSLGGSAQFFKTDGPGVDCWEMAYGEGDLFDWLLRQRRSSAR